MRLSGAESSPEGSALSNRQTSNEPRQKTCRPNVPQLFGRADFGRVFRAFGSLRIGRCAAHRQPRTLHGTHWLLIRHAHRLVGEHFFFNERFIGGSVCSKPIWQTWCCRWTRKSPLSRAQIKILLDTIGFGSVLRNACTVCQRHGRGGCGGLHHRWRVELGAFSWGVDIQDRPSPEHRKRTPSPQTPSQLKQP